MNDVKVTSYFQGILLISVVVLVESSYNYEYLIFTLVKSVGEIGQISISGKVGDENIITTFS